MEYFHVDPSTNFQGRNHYLGEKKSACHSDESQTSLYIRFQLPMVITFLKVETLYPS